MQLDQIIRIAAILTVLLLVSWILASFLNKKRKERRAPKALVETSNFKIANSQIGFSTPLPPNALFPLKQTITGFQKGAQYLNHENYDAAITEFTNYIEANGHAPNRELVHLYRAYAYQMTNQVDNALSDYNAALRYNPIVQGYVQRADFKLHYLSNYKEALEDVETALKHDPNQLNAYLIRGVVRANLKQEGVFEDFEQAFRLARHTNHASIYVQRAQAYYALNNLTAALKDFREAIRLNSDQTDYCLSMMAQIFREKRDFKQALAICDERIKHDSKNPNVYMTRGFIRHRSGDVEGAIADYEKVMELNPKNAGSYNNRAWVYVTQGKLDEALTDSERAIIRDANYEYSFGTRGTVYLLQGKYNDAISDFDRAIAIKSDHKYAILGQAMTLFQMGNLVEARDRWNALRTVDPQYATINNLRDEVFAPQAFLDIVSRLINEFQIPQDE